MQNVELLHAYVHAHDCHQNVTEHEHRVAAYDITGHKTTETPSIIFRFFHKTAWQESSNYPMRMRTAVVCLSVCGANKNQHFEQ